VNVFLVLSHWAILDRGPLNRLLLLYYPITDNHAAGYQLASKTVAFRKQHWSCNAMENRKV